MTEAELFEVIRRELYVNEANTDVEFHHKKRAEYLERAIYVCPECGLSEFHSEGAFVECKKCRRKVEYLPSKELRGVGFDLPFRFVLDWYEYQKDFVSRLDLSPYTEEPLYRDTVDFYRVIPSVKKELIQKRVELSLYGDRLCHTHFNDNLGSLGKDITWLDDLHYTMGDGIVDWQNVMTRIRKTGYSGIIMCELTRLGREGHPPYERYSKMTTEEFARFALERAQMVVRM
jgi:hypothetical protein